MYGFACGIQLIASIRYVEETVPWERVGFFIPLFLVSMSVAKLFAILFSLGMPDDHDYDGLMSTGYWRFMLIFPIIPYLGFLLCMKFVVTTESLKFLLIKQEYDTAKDQISKIYDDT